MDIRREPEKMRYFLTIIFLVAGCTTSLHEAVKQGDMQKVEAHQNPVVRIVIVAVRKVPDRSSQRTVVEQWTGNGSGFVVDSQGYVVTNDHVVSPQDDVAPWQKPSISVTVDAGTPTERTYPAQIVAADDALDLAVLKMRGNLPRLSITRLGMNKQITVGDQVKVKGYPEGGSYMETTGKVIKTISPEASATPSGAIATDAKATPGNSGGPLVSHEGIVFGVVVKSTRAKKVKEENLPMMTQLTQLNELLKKRMAEIDKREKETGTDSPEKEEESRRIMAKLEQQGREFKSAIEIFSEISELEGTTISIPVDSVRMKLKEWGIPFETESVQ